jgi:hypothetical protein
MNNRATVKATPPIDFHDAQGNAGDSYFIYIIQVGAHSGGGASCYFWFSSAEHFFQSLIAHGDFWDWGNGWEVASRDIKDIVSASTESETIFEALNQYMSSTADLTLYAWGVFEDLLYGDDPFCSEVRSDFRETRMDQDDDQAVEDPDAARVISQDEIDDFCEFLADTPT